MNLYNPFKYNIVSNLPVGAILGKTTMDVSFNAPGSPATTTFVWDFNINGGEGFNHMEIFKTNIDGIGFYIENPEYPINNDGNGRILIANNKTDLG